MEKEEIQSWDWQRILIGNTPGEFMLEVFLRTVVIYVVLLVVMRLLGKRMNTNVSILDMAIMVLLGAIVSPGMQLPDRGVLATILVLVCVVGFQRIVSLLAFKSRKIEVLTQGDVTRLVENGVIDVRQLRKSVISHEELFEYLRGQKVRQLGQVKRVYLEGSGQLSIFRNAQDQPGLCILPAEDEAVYRGEARSPRLLACKNCGTAVPGQLAASQPCGHCGARDWDPAVAAGEENQPGSPGPDPRPEPRPVPFPRGG